MSEGTKSSDEDLSEDEVIQVVKVTESSSIFVGGTPTADKNTKSGHEDVVINTSCSSTTKSSQSTQTAMNRQFSDIAIQVSSSPDTDSQTTTNGNPCIHHQNTSMSFDETAPIFGNFNLCKSCSRSMLSYIMIVQQFLNNVARDVSRQVDPLAQCFECVKDSLHLPPLQSPHEHSHSVGDDENTKLSSQGRTESNTHRASYSHKVIPTTHKKIILSTGFQNQSYESKPSSKNGGNTKFSSGEQPSTTTGSSPKTFQDNSGRIPNNNGNFSNPSSGASSSVSSGTREQLYEQKLSNSSSEHGSQNEDSKLGHLVVENHISSSSINDTSSEMTSTPAASQSPQDDDDTCDIISALHYIECSLRKSEIHTSLWEHVEQQEFTKPLARDFDHAFVTFARNNSDVLGCLVLGTSLLLCRTTKTTCVLVSEAVNPSFMGPLSSIFYTVLHVRSLDSVGTTKLSLLDQPELGITFGKLNVWRLTQYKRCVFLSPDTLVIKNCDELFGHKELSAVPDIGWPDCFNSAVFVYSPSVETFSKLLDFAENQGSYDGGDQGLLNSYFCNWSQDISKKLSFIYNLMANVSYTYTPAYKQFGGNVKVIQFMGTYKPWHVKFFSESGTVAPSSTVHPIYVQFVHIWTNIFRANVLPILSAEIQNYTHKQKTISAYDLLRFFPSNTETDVDYLPTPPSVRIRPMDNFHLNKPHEIQKLNLPPVTSTPVIVPITPDDSSNIPSLNSIFAGSDDQTPEDSSDGSKFLQETEHTVVDEGDENNKSTNNDDASLIPGAEIGDYQGMLAWEQGRMDYEGTASSDNVINRIRFLMDN